MALTKTGTDGIKDDAVTLDKLAHGTLGQDGKFLRANNGAAPTFETVNTTPEGTAILSTGETGSTKFLREDGDGTCSWQAVPAPAAFDDNNVVNDISALALQINALQNASKFATSSVYVDNFNDATGLDSFSSMARHADGYINSQHNFGTEQYWATTDLDSYHVKNLGWNGGSASVLIDGATNIWGLYISSPTSYTKGFGYDIGADSDFGQGFILTGVRFYNINTNGRFAFFQIQTADSGGNASGTFTAQDISGQGTYDTSYTSTTDIVKAQNVNGWVGGTLTTPYVVPSNTAALRLVFHSNYNNGNNNAGVSEIQLQGQKFSSNNATGHFISNAITASASTSSMGAVILYKDTHGTATLNTDLKVYLSADNGSNFAQGTLVALPDFATGVKMAKVNDVTVTAGTQLKYKVEVANQAYLSKETRVTGVSVQY